MKLKTHIYKLIFSLALIIIIFIPLKGKAANSAETQINTQQAVSEANAQYNYFNFSKFQYTGNIISWDTLIENIDSDKKDTYSADDDYDHFESSKPIKDLYPLITGTVIINTNTNPTLFINVLGDNSKDQALYSVQQTFFKKDWEDIQKENNCQDFNYYLGIYKTISKNYNSEFPYFLATDVNLKYYKCLHKHLELTRKIIKDKKSSWLSNFKQTLSNIEFASNSLQFVAGMKFEKSGSTTQTKTYWDQNFKSSAANKAKVDLFLNDTSKKNAFGACYEANPKGTNNRCANTIANNCSNQTASGKGKAHFLYGITCENINSLIKADNYKAKIVPAKDLSTLVVKEREKIDLKIQVPFNKIQDGIALHTYINVMYEYLVGIGLFLAGFMLILGGIQYIGQQPDNGKKNIKNAVIGVILLTSSYSILQVINPNTLNLKDLTNIEEIKRDSLGATVNQSDIDVPNNKLNDIFDPKIKIQEDWCFPVLREHMDISKFKQALHYTSSLAFGFNRTANRHKEKYPNTTICHAGLDIYTKYETTPGVDPKTKAGRQGDGTVVAIADGKVLINGNHFTTCGKAKYNVGSIVIDHGDFVARYGEVNNESKTTLKKGDEVKAGQVLGKATYCGMLHFEIFAKGAWSGGNWYPNQRFTREETISCLKKEMTVNFKKNTSEYCADGSCKKDWQHLKYLKDPTNFLKELYQKAQPSHCGTR